MALDSKAFLTSIFEAAVAAADPERTVRNHLPAKPKGRTIVIGAGKGSAQMAAAFEKAWDGPIEGLVVTRYGYAAPCERIEIIEAAHPVPDEAGLTASKRLLEKVSGLTAERSRRCADLGRRLGAAAVAGAGTDARRRDRRQRGAARFRRADRGDEYDPQACLDESRADASRRLLIRQRWSPSWSPTSPGDDPALVASGPTIPGEGSRADALNFVKTYGMKLPDAVMAHLNSPEADAPTLDDAALCRQRSAPDRLRGGVARGGGGRSETPRRRSRHPVRFHRGRGARGRLRPRGAGA